MMIKSSKTIIIDTRNHTGAYTALSVQILKFLFVTLQKVLLGHT